MALLHEIQASLIDTNLEIGTILLKLRFLADRLGNVPLEEWVRHETEGYPTSVSVPDYRRTHITYTGTFSNGFQTLNNITIPPYIIQSHAGDQWTDHSIAEALPVIEAMMRNTSESGSFGIDASNLKLLLEGKIYEDYAIIELNAKIQRSAFIRILTTVRARLLDLTLALERQIPVSALVSIQGAAKLSSTEQFAAKNLTQNIFNGTVNNISNSGSNSVVTMQIETGNRDQLLDALKNLGLETKDAIELAEIVASETPDSPTEPIGKRAGAWLAEKSAHGVGLVFKGGVEVGKSILTELLMKYYGLK